MNKWIATGGVYTFEIIEKEDSYDITVTSSIGKSSTYWSETLEGAKRFLKREYAGIKFTRFKKIII